MFSSVIIERTTILDEVFALDYCSALGYVSQSDIYCRRQCIPSFMAQQVYHEGEKCHSHQVVPSRSTYGGQILSGSIILIRTPHGLEVPVISFFHVPWIYWHSHHKEPCLYEVFSRSFPHPKVLTLDYYSTLRYVSQSGIYRR